MAKWLGDVLDIVMGIGVLDLQTARNGDYISLKNHEGVIVLLVKGQGTAGDDPTLTFRQATNVAGGSVKNLATITEWHTKQEAAANLEATGTWTRTTQTAAATVAGDGTSAESTLLLAAEIMANQLDAANGFDCVQVNVGDVGNNAQYGTLLYILVGPRYKTNPANLPSAITN